MPGLAGRHRPASGIARLERASSAQDVGKTAKQIAVDERLGPRTGRTMLERTR